MVLAKNTRQFAELIYYRLKGNNDCNIAFAGETGTGKTTCSYNLAKDYSKLTDNNFNLSFMTWDLKQLTTWINGEKETRKGQLPEYSAIIADELIFMFYSKEWAFREQREAVKLFNTCRDRHLLFMGNVPNFLDIDSSLRDRIFWYIYVVARGKAWIFQKEENPFTKDKWNMKENAALFRKYKSPYKSPNFFAELYFNDMTKSEKEAYLELRNTKRIEALDNKRERKKNENLSKKDKRLILQRDIVIKELYKREFKINNISKTQFAFKFSNEFDFLSIEKIKNILTGV